MTKYVFVSYDVRVLLCFFAVLVIMKLAGPNKEKKT